MTMGPPPWLMDPLAWTATLGEVVSLRLEMAAYFRRSTQPAVEPVPGVQQ